MIDLENIEEQPRRSNSLLRTIVGVLAGVVFFFFLFFLLTLCIQVFRDSRGLTSYKLALFISAFRNSLIYPVSRYIIVVANVQFLLHNLPRIALCSVPFGVIGGLLVSRKRVVRVIGIWTCCAFLLLYGALTMVTYLRLLEMSGL